MLTPSTAKNQNFPYLRKGMEFFSLKLKMYFSKTIYLLSLPSLTHQGLLAQAMPLEFAIHNFQPGDWILIQSWIEAKLQP